MACAVVVLLTSQSVGSGSELLVWALVSVALIAATVAVLVIIGRRRRSGDADSSEDDSD